MAAEVQVSEVQRSVEIPAGHHEMAGFLDMPHDATGIVVFALRSGRGRFRSRNQYVANILQRAGVATLLLDLLDEREADVRTKLFDIAFLVRRLKTAAAWLRSAPQSRDLLLGYFGTGTGAATALVAAAHQGTDVKAVACRNARSDLAEDVLPQVRASTLFLVGEKDERCILLNRRAMARLRCEKQLTIIQGATRLFAESGALERVAYMAAGWFQRHLKE
jgi:dienelactone hydrolase